MPVTRDYVHYLTSSTVLLGAEFDKVISIAVVTVVMAVVIVRARRLLVNSVTEQTAVRELSRFFDPEVANRIVGSTQEVKPGQGEMRDAAALFTDLRGFTSLSKMMTPAEMIELLSEYQSRMVPVIQRHGGSIDKFLGDGIMASFGAALRSDRYAADALRAVDDLAQAARDWAADRQALGKMMPGMGMAVAVGPVIFGAIGDATRLEYTVIGDTVNLAAKLEKHTKIERVQALAAYDALILAEQQGYVAPAPKELRLGCEVAGVDHLVDLVILAPGY
jgi:adenylate cyclase